MDTLLAGYIHSFLKEHRECDSNSGWAQVTDEDLDKLGDIIDRLIELKCDTDSDGDFPIQWTLVDRRKYHRSPYAAVPHSLDITSLDDPLLEDVHGAVSLNVALAHEEHSQFTRLMTDLFRERRRSSGPHKAP